MGHLAYGYLIEGMRLSRGGKSSRMKGESLMDSFTKTVRLGTVRIGEQNASVFCSVKWRNGRLSISGVEGPNRFGGARGSCGQIRGHLSPELFENFAPGWDSSKVRKFLALWDRWHLNDLTAGSPAQESFLRDHPVNAVYPESHYDKACQVLAAAGLNPDLNYLHEGSPYNYGHAWLTEEVPAEVIEWLGCLPDADRTPAWV